MLVVGYWLVFVLVDVDADAVFVVDFGNAAVDIGVAVDGDAVRVVDDAVVC